MLQYELRFFFIEKPKHAAIAILTEAKTFLSCKEESVHNLYTIQPAKDNDSDTIGLTTCIRGLWVNM